MKQYPEEEVDPKTIPFTNYVIIVPTEEDRIELIEASKHIHDSDTNKNFIVINQLSHEYLLDKARNHSLIIVDKEAYEKLLPKGYR